MEEKQGPKAKGGKWGWQGGAERKEGSQSKGAESQLSVVEFRAAGAGFGVSLPGN